MGRICVVSLIAALGFISGCDTLAESRGSEELVALPLDITRTSIIGSIDGVDALTEIGQVFIGPNSEIFIGQPSERIVRMVDGRGLVKTIGAHGDGPGEFRHIEAIGVTDEGLYVSDSGLLRVSYFDFEGKMIRTMAWATAEERLNDFHAFAATAPHVLLSDGSALLAVRTELSSIDVPVTGTEVLRSEWSVPFVRIDSGGSILNTLARVPRSSASLGLVEHGTVFRFIDPFNFDPLWALIPNPSGGLVSVIGDSISPGTFRVDRMDVAGDLVTSKSFRQDPMPVSEMRLSRAVEVARETMYPTIPDIEIGTDAIVDAFVDNSVIPEWLPPVTVLAATQDGSIWLRGGEAADSVVWHRLDADLRVVGSIHLLYEEEIVASNGPTVVTAWTDELDVPYLSVYHVGP